MASDLLIASSHIFPRTHGFCSTSIPAVINNNTMIKLLLGRKPGWGLEETFAKHVAKNVLFALPDRKAI